VLTSLLVVVIGDLSSGLLNTRNPEFLGLVVSIEQLGNLLERQDTVLALGLDGEEVQVDKLEGQEDGAARLAWPSTSESL
jgi:hypothetical protein